MKIFIFAFLASFLQAEPVYVPPKEDIPLIRRDQLPLDVPSLQRLSKQLSALASQGRMESAQDFRASAQLIGLALHLDPVNAEANRLNRELSAQKPPLTASEEVRAAAADSLWRTSEWLLFLDDKPEAQKLAQLILEPLSHFDQARPLPENADLDEKNWAGTIASLQEFGHVQEVAESPENHQFFKNKTVRYAMPAIGREAARATFRRSRGERRARSANPSGIHPVSLKILDKTNHTSPYNDGMIREEVTLLTRNITQKATDSDLVFVQKIGLQTAAVLEEKVREFFKNQGADLPSDIVFSVDLSGSAPTETPENSAAAPSALTPPPQLSLPAENLYNFVAPLALMLDSCISGQKLKKNTVLLANLNTDGSLSVPNEAWQVLQQITQYDADFRVIIPAALEPQLNAFLPLKSPEKLFETEFILANTYAEARPFLFEGETEPTGVVAAHEHWQEVKDKQTKDNTTEDYLNFTGVHDKLRSAIEASPRHLSAKHLYFFGSKNKPTHLHREVVAQELCRYLVQITPMLARLSAGENPRENERALSPADRADRAERATKQLLADLEKLRPIVGFDDRQLLIDTADSFEQILAIVSAYRAGRNHMPLLVELAERSHAQHVKFAELAHYPKPEKPWLSTLFRPGRASN